MTHNLFDLTVAVYDKIGALVYGTASGSNVDVNLAGAFNDDHFNQGLFFAFDNPQVSESGTVAGNTMDFVDDFEGATCTYTLRIGHITIAKNLIYAVATARYPGHNVVAQISRAVQSWGGRVAEDTTSLDTAINQTEYTLPLENMDLKRVYIQGRTGDVDDNRWLEVRNWTLKQGAGEAADTLILPAQPVAGRDIRLTYVIPHLRFYLNFNSSQPPGPPTWTDLDPQIPFEWVVAHAAYNCVRNRAMLIDDLDPGSQMQLQLLQGDVVKVDGLYPRRRPSKKARLTLAPRI